jgi:16S rRNA (uracil1498-N3)-methyltransferase
MKIHRFIGNFDLKADRLKLPDEESHQIRNVLKLKPTEQIWLGDGQGNDALAVILDIGKKTVEVGIQDRLVNAAEPKHAVALYCAILKHENFDLVIQKATEVGATEIIPLITARTVKTDVKLERLWKIAKEAAELSGRGRIPVVRSPSRFAIAVENAASDAVHFMFDSSGTQFKMPPAKSVKALAAWIGPEGGWNEEELELGRVKGFNIATLGPRILRGETAAIVATYLLSQ